MTKAGSLFDLPPSTLTADLQLHQVVHVMNSIYKSGGLCLFYRNFILKWYLLRKLTAASSGQHPISHNV